ncbi:MAG: ATP-binding protein [Paludibacteraceae bacterium]|nr:ATP-binding protein [Paludibacteraceae bacterium]
MKFYDREKELDVLRENENQSHKSATFTVLMGRRRVGKTSLIMRAMHGIASAYLFVSKDSEALLCQKFQRAIEEQLNIHVYGTLSKFRDLFEVIMRESQTRPFTVIIDEFQNLYKVNPAIFSEIQDIWDRYHAESHINLIASGSIMSLMRRIFENENEPLYGRPTSKMTLRPFTIATFKQIFSDYCPNYKNEDLLCLYMITGGVAKYVELLMDAGCYTKEKMLNYVCRMDSYFLSEGKDIINNEFGSDYNTYYSILQLIANGMNHRSDIDGALQKDSGTFLQNLEQNFGMVSRIRPILSSPNSKMTSYEITDPFLRFWFRFICPYQALIESGQLKLLRENINTYYESFTGRTLERYFQTQLMESGEYSQVGNWWDKKGGNEIDVVALNEFTHTGLIAEVKRNERKLSLSKLEEKLAYLPQREFGNYKFELRGLSMIDM